MKMKYAIVDTFISLLLNKKIQRFYRHKVIAVKFVCVCVGGTILKIDRVVVADTKTSGDGIKNKTFKFGKSVELTVVVGQECLVRRRCNVILGC